MAGIELEGNVIDITVDGERIRYTVDGEMYRTWMDGILEQYKAVVESQKGLRAFLGTIVEKIEGFRKVNPTTGEKTKTLHLNGDNFKSNVIFENEVVFDTIEGKTKAAMVREIAAKALEDERLVKFVKVEYTLHPDLLFHAGQVPCEEGELVDLLMKYGAKVAEKVKTIETPKGK